MIAASLRRAREEAGLTRAELAARVGVAEKAVAAYEGEGARLPRADVLARLLCVLGPKAPWFEERVREASRVRRGAEPLATPAAGAATSRRTGARRARARSGAAARASAMLRQERLQKIARVDRARRARGA